MWTLTKINELITNGVEENMHLDYKSAASLSGSEGAKKEITKDVSAFANSDGGIIIYGIKEYDERSKSHLPERIDPVDGKKFSKEWLEQVINNISPRIDGLIITPVQCNHKEDNKVIYVVDIPKSNTAHQSKDNRYYKRYNFQSSVMYDWEVKDVINRYKQSRIDIVFKQTMPNGLLSKIFRDPSKISLDIYANNSGHKVVKYVECFISGEADTAIFFVEPYFGSTNFEHCFSNEIDRTLSINDQKYIVNVDRVAILPNTMRKIGKVVMQKSFLESREVLNFHISTDDSSTRYELTGNSIKEQIF